jgi:hypothetical protein
MTITKRQIGNWVEKESRRVDAARARDQRDRDMALRVLEEPQLCVELSDERLQHLVWNLAWAIAFAPVGDAWTVSAVAAAPSLLASIFGDATQNSNALSMFWDVAISTPLRSDVSFRGAVFESLTAQLGSPNPWVQASALHGFGHLEEPRCRPVIRDFLRRCEDSYLVEYARQAMAFKVL